MDLSQEEDISLGAERLLSGLPCERSRSGKSETEAVYEADHALEQRRFDEVHRFHSSADLTLACLMAHLKRGRIALALAALTLACLGWQAFKAGPDSLVVVEYTLDLPAWPAALNGFRIAAVGDIHGGAPFIDESKLVEVTTRITAAKPDLVVWLGDYVIQGVRGGTFMDPETIARILARAQAPYGHVAILGNHDRWLDPIRVERAFEAARVPFLRWSSREIVVKGVRVHLYGLDDFELSPDYWGTFAAANKLWTTLDENEPLIVLSHSPDVFPWIPARVNLTLAAHTHGGQVRFPLIGSPIVPSSFGQRYARGPIRENGRQLFVNTGIGTSIIPVRFGVPPEISLLTVRRAARKEGQ
jgi:predicted MPP superfamily phosphohydrolase